jgi:hypothetical protein
MGTGDQRQGFDEIVKQLTTDDPEFGKLARETPRALSRGARTVLLISGGLIWALLSVLMVAWGWPGVMLTVLAVAYTARVLATGSLIGRERGRDAEAAAGG